MTHLPNQGHLKYRQNNFARVCQFTTPGPWSISQYWTVLATRNIKMLLFFISAIPKCLRLLGDPFRTGDSAAGFGSFHSPDGHVHGDCGVRTGPGLSHSHWPWLPPVRLVCRPCLHLLLYRWRHEGRPNGGRLSGTPDVRLNFHSHICGWVQSSIQNILYC